MVGGAVFLPLGLDRPVEPEVGLAARGRSLGDGSWSVTVTTRRFAQWVVVEVAGFAPSDSWFHLAPGASRTLTLVPEAGAERPTGHVRALNAVATARIEVGP
jgi:beta-mannosidase